MRPASKSEAAHANNANPSSQDAPDLKLVVRVAESGRGSWCALLRVTKIQNLISYLIYMYTLVLFWYHSFSAFLTQPITTIPLASKMGMYCTARNLPSVWPFHMRLVKINTHIAIAVLQPVSRKNVMVSSCASNFFNFFKLQGTFHFQTLFYQPPQFQG